MAEERSPIDYIHLAPKTEIRLLTLKQGSGADPITCTLRHATQGEEEYQALSYEWGDESEDDPSILVQDQPIGVRRNLFEALKNIRKPSEDLQLWIDAICINQANIQEKNHQVAMMGEIFASAISVIAWLGPAKEGSDLAMDWMADKIRLRLNLLRCGKSSSELAAVVALCHRPYWRRVWIIQELFLARSYVVCCGTKAIPSAAFEVSVACLNKDMNTPYEGAFEHNPAHYHGQARLFDKWTPHVNILRRWMAICVQGKFQCTTKHDMIYSLLGISHDYTTGRITIEIDYTKSPRQVFLEVLQQYHSEYDRLAGMFMKFAEMMDIQMDESLRTSIFEIMNKDII
jgi:hypothetical protein